MDKLPLLLTTNIMKTKSNPIEVTKYPKTRKGQFTQFLRKFSIVRNEYLACEGRGKLVKFDYQLALVFKTKHDTIVLDTSTITKSSLTHRTLSSHCTSYGDYLVDFFTNGVMNEEFLQMAEAVIRGPYQIELWVDATPLVCEYGQSPTELGELHSADRVSACVAELSFSWDFILQLSENVLLFYKNSMNEVGAMMGPAELKREVVWWTHQTRFIKMMSNFFKPIT